LVQEIHQTKDIMGLEEVIIEHYKELGLQEGRQEGLQEGRQEGRQEGLQEGRQEGLQEGIRLSIQKMLEKNFLPEFVANTLSVELKMVQEVQQAMKNGSAGHHN
ncbi:MAG: Yae1 family protein, partial [Bacteroidota bacterium]